MKSTFSRTLALANVSKNDKFQLTELPPTSPPPVELTSRKRMKNESISATYSFVDMETLHDAPGDAA